MRKLLTTFVVLTVIMLIVAGCTAPAPAPASVPDAQAAVCTALATLKTAVAQLGTVTADTTIEQVQTMQKDIDTAVEGVKTAAKAVPAAKIDSVTAAIDGVQSCREGDRTEHYAGRRISIDPNCRAGCRDRNPGNPDHAILQVSCTDRLPCPGHADREADRHAGWQSQLAARLTNSV